MQCGFVANDERLKSVETVAVDRGRARSKNQVRGISCEKLMVQATASLKHRAKDFLHVKT